MAEKPNSAEFADQREFAMLRSRKNGNPGLRMVPEISSARAAKTLTETESNTPPTAANELETDVSEPEIDYEATSDAIIEALRKIDGHITLSDTEKEEASSILGCKPTKTPSMLGPLLLGVVAGVGISQLMKKKPKQEV